MIRFMKFKWLYLGFSAALVVISIASLSIWRLRPSIDFTGGALLEVKFPEKNDVNGDDVRSKADEVKDVDVYSVIYSQDGKSYQIRTNTIDEAKKGEVISNLGKISKVEEVRFESVGPTLGKELLIKTLFAVLIASAIILSYVAYQFKDRIFGLAAILAMFHDTLILIGVFSLLGKFIGIEVDTLFVTAVLTTLSFSVHDTIVVFDRIRETLKQFPNANFEDVADKAVTETLQRSLNNSMTIIFMLTALAFLGGITIRWFVTALLIGTVLGTYSSPFVAVPILLIFIKKRAKRK